jgi:hypothetical protein
VMLITNTEAARAERGIRCVITNESSERIRRPY